MDDRQKALSVNRFSGFGRTAGCFGMVFGFVFCSMFSGIGFFFFWLATLQPGLEVLDARSWVETQCTIESSEVEDNRNRSLRIAYDYTFNGRQYQAERYNLAGQWNGDRTAKERVVAKYKEGTQHPCYVDPDNPSQAVLDRSASGEMWFGLFGLPFMLIGLVGYFLIFFVRSKLTGKLTELEEKATAATFASPASQQAASQRASTSFDRMTPKRVASHQEWGHSDFDEEDLFEEPGPIMLESDSSTMTTALFLFVFALFWNGIISIILVTKLSDAEKLQWEDLFFVPFLLIGIGVFLAAIYSFLATFNPKPSLVLSRQLIPLGGNAQLQWVFEAGTGSIRHLQVMLVGVEEATYRRGTNTHTDTETFYEEVLFETSVPLEMNGGEVDIPIPTDSMHSFHGGNNKIKWNVAIKGDIPFWPDINEQFPIRVVPHE